MWYLNSLRVNGADGWDSMADDESLAELFWAVGRSLRHSARDALAAWDLSPSQARALGALSADGPSRLGELAGHLRITPRSATEVVDQLEQRALVQRTPDPQDRRATIVGLTDPGASMAAAISAVKADQAEAVFDTLDARDRSELTRLLLALRERGGGPGGRHGDGRHNGGHREGHHH